LISDYHIIHQLFLFIITSALLYNDVFIHQLCPDPIHTYQ
jgi:hypothetical protein